MLALLLITALAVQNPQPATKPTQDTTASRRPAATQRATQSAPRDASQAAVSRAVFHDRMRELWTDHIAYTRSLIVSASAGLGDTAEVTQRLLRNQDEIGDAIKPYYGDAAGTQLASLLRTHIQLAGQTLAAAKGPQPSQVGMNNMNMPQDNAAQYQSQPSRAGDTTKANNQYPTPQGRVNNDTTASKKMPPTQGQNPPARTDSAPGQNRDYAQGQMGQNQAAGQVDSTALQAKIAALRANGDSIAALLASANPKGFSKETLRGALQMHLNLLLQEVTAYLKKDWSGSIAALDESQRQIVQMADMLSDGIMKQFPSRFTNKTTNVSMR